MQRKSIKRGIFTVAVIAASAYAAYFVAFLAYPPAGVALLLIAGRGPECGRWEALKAYYRHYRSRSAEPREVNASRILSSDPAGFQLVESSMGRFWEPAIEGHSSVLAQVTEMEFKYLGVSGLLPQPGEIVLDCGANVGVFTRKALDSGARTVVAIEPAPKNVVCLKRNFAAEISKGQVMVIEKGVWDREDLLRLGEHEDTPAEDSFVKHQKTHSGPVVPLTTIDNLVRDLSLDRVDFIKMDIEGAEQRALTGAAETLAEFRPRLEISVNHLPEDPVQVPLIVKRAWPGYSIECLRCEPGPHRRIAAEILFFR